MPGEYRRMSEQRQSTNSQRVTTLKVPIIQTLEEGPCIVGPLIHGPTIHMDER